MVNWLVPIRLQEPTNKIDYSNNEFKIGLRLHVKFLFKTSNKVSNFSGLYLNLGKPYSYTSYGLWLGLALKIVIAGEDTLDIGTSPPV